MRRTFQIVLLSLLALTSVSVLAADKVKFSRGQMNKLEETQRAYDAALRWSTIEDALPYLDPEYTRENPMTDLEVSRYEQVKISSYQGGANQRVGNDRMGRNVDVSVINKNTQQQREVRVQEIWRWDAEDKRWLQASGLPDLWKTR
ncbi:MAG: hypothetical protein ACRESP_08395 [Pseudomonas sp.]